MCCKRKPAGWEGERGRVTASSSLSVTKLCALQRSAWCSSQSTRVVPSGLSAISKWLASICTSPLLSVFPTWVNYNFVLSISNVRGMAITLLIKIVEAEDVFSITRHCPCIARCITFNSFRAKLLRAISLCNDCIDCRWGLRMAWLRHCRPGRHPILVFPPCGTEQSLVLPQLGYPCPPLHCTSLVLT